MPKARNRKERCAQILNWLKEERPCGRPVALKWVKWTGKEMSKTYAQVTRNGNSLTVSMNARRCNTWFNSIDTLIHEYAHCRLWGMAHTETSDKIDFHGPDFWAEFGIIYNMFYYSDGWDTSKRYDRR